MIRLECKNFYTDSRAAFGSLLSRLGFFLVRNASGNPPHVKDVFEVVGAADVAARVLAMRAFDSATAAGMRGEHPCAGENPRIRLVNIWRKVHAG